MTSCISRFCQKTRFWPLVKSCGRVASLFWICHWTLSPFGKTEYQVVDSRLGSHGEGVESRVVDHSRRHAAAFRVPVTPLRRGTVATVTVFRIVVAARKATFCSFMRRETLSSRV